MSGMNVQPIGKGMCRVTVDSATRRNKLSRIPGVKIVDDRVYFPEERACMVMNYGKSRKQKVQEAEKNQISFLE